METITSKNNEKIKYAVSLREHTSARKASGSFFIEGARLCADAAESGTEILQAFFTEKCEGKFRPYIQKICSAAREVFRISEDVSAKLSETKTPQGVYCVCKLPACAAADFMPVRGGKYLLLENVQDPSNLGAIGRTAEALGLTALLVSGGCDVFCTKALRASMGAFFRLPVFYGEAGTFADAAKKAGLPVFASTPKPDAQTVTRVNMKQGCVCVIGNEGNGVSEALLTAADLCVTIPMRGRAESLNAATAAAILSWEMMRDGD